MRVLLLLASGVLSGCASASATRAGGSGLRFDGEILLETPKRVADGEHWRIQTGRGPVHVWRPSGYRGNMTELVDWLAVGDGPFPRLVLVPRETAGETQKLLEGFPEAQRRPLHASEVGPPTGARVLVLGAADGHMELVTEGRALPLALRMTALPAL